MKKRILPAAISLLLLFLLWQLASAALSRPFLPPPLGAVQALWLALTEGNLAMHLWVSGYRVGLALICALVPATLLGLAMGRLGWLDRLLAPLLFVLYPLPKVVFLPIIVVLCGLGDFSKIFLIALVLFFQLLMVARDAALHIPEGYLLSARALSMGRCAVFRYVLLPACLPQLFTALRVGLGTAIAILFFAESFASVRGVGYYITDAMSRRTYDEMFAGIMALALLGLFYYIPIELLCRRLHRYADTAPQ